MLPPRIRTGACVRRDAERLSQRVAAGPPAPLANTATIDERMLIGWRRRPDRARSRDNGDRIVTASNGADPAAERVRCRDQRGRRAWIEVYSDHTGNVILQMPDGEHVTADERFFLVKSGDASLSRDGWTALEQDVMTEHKWWSREELAQTSATVWPENLLAMLDAAMGPE